MVYRSLETERGSKTLIVDLQLEQIERQFDRAAATYDSVASVQRQMADQLLLEIPAQLDGPLVDLGCGTGDLLYKLSERTSATNLTGIDISSAMLEQTRHRVPGAQAIKADLAALPLDDNSCRWAVSNAAIQWCDSKAVFSELRRVLQPGGRAFISTFGPSTMWQWRETIESVSSTGNRVHTFESVEQLTSGLRASGFASVESRIENVDIQFDSVRAMFDSIRKLGATNARRDRPTGLSGRQWFQQITEAFEERRERDGMLNLTYECCYLFAS